MPRISRGPGQPLQGRRVFGFRGPVSPPRPIVHLLPGHPREERKSVDSTLDDEFLQKRSEYSHGPLVGHRVPCDHPLLEARLSEAAFPWLAEHRVHHAPIMPAAGFIELVLEALEGAPAHIETLEFLQPCPIPRVPVRLQTALQPVPNSPDEYTVAISSQPYELDAKCELHCRGQVRRVGPDHAPDVPGHVSEIDTSRYEPLSYAADDELYERIETVLGETFQYGPHFRNMRQLRRDVGTDHLMFDVEVDEALWRGGQQEGYVMLPALLDGGLQSYLYDLMLGADLFAIPAPGGERDLPAPAHGSADDLPRPPIPTTFDTRSTTRVNIRCRRANGSRAASPVTTARPATSSCTSKNTSPLSRTRGGSTCRTASIESSGSPSSSPTARRSRTGCRTAISSHPSCLPPSSGQTVPAATRAPATRWSSRAPERRSGPCCRAASSISRARRRKASSGSSPTMRRARARMLRCLPRPRRGAALRLSRSCVAAGGRARYGPAAPERGGSPVPPPGRGCVHAGRLAVLAGDGGPGRPGDWFPTKKARR